MITQLEDVSWHGGPRVLGLKNPTATAEETSEAVGLF